MRFMIMRKTDRSTETDARVTFCDGKPTVTEATPKAKLEEFAQMLRTMAGDKQPPPGKMADLDTAEPLLPQSAPAFRSGELVYVWGTTLSGGGAVVAYEKKAETEGGWVLLQDGTVKQMKADEFKAAPKAKK